MTCDKCGTSIEIGMHPFCPHGFSAGNTRPADVTWPGGKVFENGFDQPTRFYSPAEYRAALAARGLQVRPDMERKGVAITQATLDAAKELVSRVCGA